MTLGCLGLALVAEVVHAQVVPGTGRKLTEVGDDLEDPNWYYAPKSPKSSSNLDRRARYPTGVSSNARWFESGYRGQPDVVKRVDTPPGGLPGSKGALMLQSLHTGIPGTLTYKMQQDDFMLNVNGRVGSIPVAWSPNFVVRVYLPPFEQWENRTGSHFGVRADLIGTTWESTRSRGLFGSRFGRRQKSEAYWPGFFIQFHSKDDPQFEEDSAMLLIRCDEMGRDIPGPKITEPGWWTLGMSFTPDGRVHYYAREGVENLTAGDHICSHAPYGKTGQSFHCCFFNVVNMDDGRSWSTAFVVDDPEFFHMR